MDVEPSLYAEWVKLLPIIVGGTLTLLGGVLGQVITQYLSARRERRKFLAAKLEDVARAISSYSQWITEKQTTLLFSDEPHNSFSPLDEAVLLQRLYFPELHGEILAIMTASHPLIEFIGQQSIARKVNLEVWIKTYDSAAYDTAYVNHLEALSSAVIKCRGIAEARFN